MINYDVYKLDRDKQRLLFEKAYELRKDFWLDQLDCEISFQRQKVPGATFDDAMKYFDPRCLPSMIVRDLNLPHGEPYLEVGFRNMCNDPYHPVDYFLYIVVDLEENGQVLIDFYKELGGETRERLN